MAARTTRSRPASGRTSSSPGREPDVVDEGARPPVTTSQLSMAFIYYSVQLQKAALAKLEAQLSTLAAQTQEGDQQHETIKAEILSLRNDRQSYEKLLVEHEESTRQVTSSNMEEIRAQLQKACTDMNSQIAAANANIKALELVQEQMAEKFELQQKSINDLAKQDQTAQKQDALVQAIHQLLNSCNAMMTAKARTDSDTHAKWKCKSFQDRAQQLRDEFLNLTPDIKRPSIYSSSTGIGSRQGQFINAFPKLWLQSVSDLYAIVDDDDMDFFDPADHLDVPQDLSGSSTVTFPSEPDLPDNLNLHKGEAYLRLYDKYRRTYRVQKPRSEKKFIRRFLSRMDHNQAQYTQQKLLVKFPHMVQKKDKPVQVGSDGALEFIQLDKLTWPLVAEAIASMTGDELVSMSS